jgi:hypothetical protein
MTKYNIHKTQLENNITKFKGRGEVALTFDAVCDYYRGKSLNILRRVKPVTASLW